MAHPSTERARELLARLKRSDFEYECAARRERNLLEVPYVRRAAREIPGMVFKTKEDARVEAPTSAPVAAPAMPTPTWETLNEVMGFVLSKERQSMRAHVKKELGALRKEVNTLSAEIKALRAHSDNSNVAAPPQWLTRKKSDAA